MLFMRYSIRLFFIHWLLCSTLEVNGQNPGWTYPDPASFNYNANAVVTLKFNGVPSNDINDRVAFFDGNTIVGLSVPVPVGSEVFHFVTIYSDTVSTQLSLKAYHFAENQVYASEIPFTFEANQIYGDIASPFVLDFFTNANTPIGIDSIGHQFTLATIPFDTLFLENYLIQNDTHAVSWSYVSTQNLLVQLAGSQLLVEGIEGFIGTDTLRIRVTEQFGNPMQFAEVDVVYHVDTLYAGPLWHNIPNQGIVVGDTFKKVDLPLFEYQYGGDQLEFSYCPVIEQSTTPIGPPVWQASGVFTGTMTFTAIPKYTPVYAFDHADDRLSAWIGGDARGVAARDSVSGLFYLSVGNSQNGDTFQLKFYSGAMKKILTNPNTFVFGQSIQWGNTAAPYELDFSPIIPVIGVDTLLTFVISDSAFTGEVAFDLKAFDSIYVNELMDVRRVKLCIVENAIGLDTFYADEDGDGLGNAAVYFLACHPSEGFVSNDDDCNDMQNIDPSIGISIVDNSGYDPVDGVICSPKLVEINATGGNAYLWSTGGTGNTIMPFVSSDSSYSVTVTLPLGCKGMSRADLFIEDRVVLQPGNTGPGSLRSIVSCLMDGDTVTFEIPNVISSLLSDTLLVNHSFVLKGFLLPPRPEVELDHTTNNAPIIIVGGKTITWENVDIKVINGTSVTPSFSGAGNVQFKGKIRIRED